MAKERRSYRMTLAQFHRYLTDKCSEAEIFHGNAVKLRERYNEVFKQVMADWQGTFSFCYPRLMAERRDMPEPFVSHIDQVERQERQRIIDEIAELDIEIESGREQSDTYLSKAQEATQALRRSNPALDSREERLKAEVVRYQTEYADAYEEMESLESGGMGWLMNAGKIARLRRVQKAAKKKQAESLTEMREVRQDWKDQLETTGRRQAELREQWQVVSVRASEAQGRRDHLEANLEALAEQAAIQRVLEELAASPGVPGELGERLDEMVQRNSVRLSYEQGLKAVAEAEGLSKGVGDGTRRFADSVAKVVREQKRYNLRQVHIQIPHRVAILNETWKRLSDQLSKESDLSHNPVGFSQIIEEGLSKRLTDTTIQFLFETMGEALNTATSAWG